MKPSKGLFTDCVEQDQPEGTYRFAKNITDSNLQGVIENEDGFVELIGTAAPYNVVGIIPVQEEFVVFSTDNIDSEIGLIVRTNDTINYTTIYNDPDLNFNTSSPIKGEFRKDINNNRIVTWIDNINSPRIINIDNVTGINDVADLDVFPDIVNPKLTNPTINNTGGVLPTGAIIPITRYKNLDGSFTNWFVHDFTFYINDDSRFVAFNLNDGAEPGTISNKSITFTLTNNDLNFNQIEVGYIQSVNNITTAYRSFTLTNSATLTITITGTETTIDVTLDEILTPKAIYSNAKTITQLAGRLFYGNLTSPTLPELQTTALDIKIDYTHSLVNVISNTNSHKQVLPPTFMPGEVYAFYLGVELNKGGWVYYHIPGRTARVGDLATITRNGLTYQDFQVEDTSNPAAITNMGYWQNTNEVYPNDPNFISSLYGDMRLTPVRHHRFPTTDYLVKTHYSGDGSVGISKLPKLGINVTNVNIPINIQSQIKRWKIFYAKKDEQNSLVVGCDLLQYAIATENDSNVRWSSGGNWETTYGSSSPGAIDFRTVDRTKIRGHSLDLLYKSGITPTYARFCYKLSRNNLNTVYSGFRSGGGLLTTCGRIADTGLPVSSVFSAVIDYTTINTTRTDSGANSFTNLESFTYLPENSLNGDDLTLFNEGVFAAKLDTTPSITDSIVISKVFLQDENDLTTLTPFSNLDGTPDSGTEETCYMEYFNLLTSVHNSFQNQELVPTLQYGEPSTTSLIGVEGGDSFLCYMSYVTLAPRNAARIPQDTNRDQTEGIRVWRGYIGYSRYNFNYRYQDNSDTSTFYHGKTDVRNLFVPTVNGNLAQNYRTLLLTTDTHNTIKYTTDYNFSNIFNIGTIYHPDLVVQTNFQNTIIYSPIQNEDSKEFSWRTFLAADSYTMTKNRGDIINLQGFRNRELIIHTEDSIFRTRTDANQQVEGENIFLKSANLFDLPPEELQPSNNGYAGTQHMFGCTLTKFGYVFPDDKQGNVFLYNGESLEEISEKGMRNFFRDFMDVGPTDNPYNTNGYLTAFDERLNRIILTKSLSTESWTISYNPVKKSWTSYHDYIPQALFTTNDGSLYSLKENKFYLNNPIPNSVQKGKYYTDTIHPWFIDVVFNPNPAEDKLFTELEWVTESYPVIQTQGQVDRTLGYNNTLTHLTLYSKDRCTGKTTLSTINDTDSFYESNLRNLNGVWYFNAIRDLSISTGFVLGFYQNFNIDPTKLNINMEWFDKRKFVDKFVICRFEGDNIVNNRVLLIDTKIAYRATR